jgi:tetratricopeptide (TPR) repeat protein
MSKTRKLLASLALLALAPAASLAQSREAVTDAVAYSRSFARGVESFDAGRYKEALEAFLDAVVLNPRDPDALFDVGVTYEKLGRPLEASAAFKSVVELRPGSAKARASLCASLVSAGQYWDGVDACNRAIRQDRDDPELFEEYGRAFAGAGLYDQAAEAFKLAIRLRPDAAEYHLALGAAYERLGEYRDALDSLERAARLSSKPEDAMAEHARVTAELSDMERDLSSVEGYDRLLNVGHAYRMKGWYTKAVVAYSVAAQKRPRDAEARYYLGLTYYSMNQYYRALAWYRRALAADPKMAEARRDYDWLTAYLSGDAYGRKVGAKSKAARPARIASGERQVEERTDGVVRQK